MWESKNSCANYLMKLWMNLNGMWYTIVTCSCDEPHTHLFCPFSIQGREPYLCHFVNSKKKISLYSDIYKPASFKLGMMIEITKLSVLISVWITLTIIQGHSCMRNIKKLWCPFSHKCTYRFRWNSICCHNLLVHAKFMKQFRCLWWLIM